MKTILILTALAVTLATSPASAACTASYCRDKAATSTPSRSPITNTSRQRIGDMYSPGNGRRIQIRDNSRRILGYIEADGSITNTSRQRVGTVEEAQ